MSAPARPWTGRSPDLAGVSLRAARPEEVADCVGIWRTSINDYLARLGQPEIPPEANSVARLFSHLQATDPERFVVAVAAGDGSGPTAERVVAFVSAVEREHLWFLSMLFVMPGFQGAGLGGELLARVLPAGSEGVRATATDSAQPISNALYARLGIVPRMPFLGLNGRPTRPEAFGELPSGVTPVAFDAIASGPSDAPGHRSLVEAVDGLDRELLGVAHPLDHRFLRGEARRGWLYCGPDGSPLGYGYAGEAGRVGPIAVRDEALLAPILGHLTSVVVPRGAFATWVGGAADRAIVAALGAGFRLDGFPVLLCWDRPFADFSRYLPIGTGLL